VIQGTEILKKEEILDAKIQKFLAVRDCENTHTLSINYYLGANNELPN